jgi:cyclic pyranopterin phosphate synthase
MPVEGIIPKSPDEILSFEEIERIVRMVVPMGVNRIKITGGEPLARKGITHLVKMLSGVEGVSDISMTTNGMSLAKFTRDLKDAGLNRINISLDSLNKDRFASITRGGNISNVWQGIEEAIKAGLEPVKINVVVIKGINDDEICDFARLTYKMPLHIRFIEFMPMLNGLLWDEKKFIPNEDVKEKCETLGELFMDGNIPGSGPAIYYRLKGGLGSIGFISPLSNSFCTNCNRLRLTSDGNLRLCLHHEDDINLKDMLRKGRGDEEISKAIKMAVNTKPKGHNLCSGTGAFHYSNGAMSSIGG